MFIQNNLPQITALLGLFFLMIEVWVLGFSTVVLLALGISTIGTALLIWMDFLPETITTAIAFSGVGAGILTSILWKPLKRVHFNERGRFNIHSDYLGLTFMLLSDLDAKRPVSVKYSGMMWKLVLDPSYAHLKAPNGSNVKVVAVDVGKFIVIPEDINPPRNGV